MVVQWSPKPWTRVRFLPPLPVNIVKKLIASKGIFLLNKRNDWCYNKFREQNKKNFLEVVDNV